MNPTRTATPSKPDRSMQLAGALFDEVMVPLAKARRSSSAPPFFPPRGEESRASYFGPPSLRVMTPADFELDVGGKSEALIDALAAYWTRKGEPELAAMAPRLKQLAAALGDEASEHDGRVDILCYTLF
jgi:hypothetical protein